MTGRLDGRVALVTGASSGIGEATAEALAAEGASVVIAARREDRLAALRTRLDDKGAQVLTVPLDVTDEQQCRDAVAATVEQFGRLDILVNNAGVMLLGKIVGADTTDWTRMVNTNVLGSLYMAHAALPHLLERRGAIVQISSTAGRTVRSGAGVYNLTKWGVNAFMESLRQEVTARGVRTIIIEPGLVDTELRDHITDVDAKAAIMESAAQTHNLQSGDIADAIVYAVTQPEHVAVNEILVRPTDQAW